MSDGPYRSLPMRKAWKDVSERAHKASFSGEERAESMLVALTKDIMRDVGKSFLQALAKALDDQQQGDFFSNQASTAIDNLRNRSGQSPLRDSVSEHIQAALYSGFPKEAALVEGVNRAVQEHARGSIRGVEEHYKRDASNSSELRKTISVRENLTQTLSSEAVRNLGSNILEAIRGEALQTRVSKAIGLDDGPELS